MKLEITRSLPTYTPDNQKCRFEFKNCAILIKDSGGL